MIAAAISFNSGILLFADADSPARGRIDQASTKIFRKQYGVNRGGACSIFAVSEPVDWSVTAFQLCESALGSVGPSEATIDRMRETIERSLVEASHEYLERQPAGRELASFVVLYSPCERRYSLFRTTNSALREVAGCDCQGTAAYLGHYLMRDRYNAARSMDALDLTTVFSIATETLESVRECHPACGKSSEMVVMYADGHVSDVQRIPHDTRSQRSMALTGLART